MSRVFYGIGLPRTGTKTLARTMECLGLSGSQTCWLTKAEDNTCLRSKGPRYEVDNQLFKKYQQLHQESDHHYFIMTTRDPEDWRQSITRFDGWEDYPDISDYYKEVVDYFKFHKDIHRLLITDVRVNADAIKLCDWIKKSMVDKTHVKNVITQWERMENAEADRLAMLSLRPTFSQQKQRKRFSPY